MKFGSFCADDIWIKFSDLFRNFTFSITEWILKYKRKSNQLKAIFSLDIRPFMHNDCYLTTTLKKFIINASFISIRVRDRTNYILHFAVMLYCEFSHFILHKDSTKNTFYYFLIVPRAINKQMNGELYTLKPI